jgi:hypothetical protein
MRSVGGCESQHGTASTHPLSDPTCSEVGESHGSFVEIANMLREGRTVSPQLIQGRSPLSYIDFNVRKNYEQNFFGC